MEGALAAIFAAIDASGCRRAEKGHLRKHSITVALSTVLGGSPQHGHVIKGSSCHARDKVLCAAGEVLGRKLGVHDLQIELRDRGHSVLLRKLESLSKARRVEAHPAFAMNLVKDIACAFQDTCSTSFAASTGTHNNSNSEDGDADASVAGLDVWMAESVLQHDNSTQATHGVADAPEGIGQVKILKEEMVEAQTHGAKPADEQRHTDAVEVKTLKEDLAKAQTHAAKTSEEQRQEPAVEVKALKEELVEARTHAAKTADEQRLKEAAKVKFLKEELAETQTHAAMAAEKQRQQRAVEVKALKEKWTAAQTHAAHAEEKFTSLKDELAEAKTHVARAAKEQRQRHAVEIKALKEELAEAQPHAARAVKEQRQQHDVEIKVLKEELAELQVLQVHASTAMIAGSGAKAAINGFGRDGRNILRGWLGRANKLFDIVAINVSFMGAKTAAHLLKYDAALETLKADVSFADDTIAVDGKVFKVLNGRDPAAMPWEDMDVEVTIESTPLSCEGMLAHVISTLNADQVRLEVMMQLHWARNVAAVVLLLLLLVVHVSGMPFLIDCHAD